MPRAQMRRKRLFRAALALAGLTETQWAEKQGISQPHLSLVLNGKRESKVLTDKVDAFIDKHLVSRNALVA